MNAKNLPRWLRPLIAALLPLAAFILQWLFWPLLQPYVWFLFYPAVFFSAWIGGLPGGLAATVLSVLLVVYFFLPPQFTFAVADPKNLLSAGVFTIMGVLFGYTQGRVKQANQNTADALQAARSINDQLETRVRERAQELAQTTELLQASETRYRGALDSMLEGCQIIGFDWRYVYLNDAAARYGRQAKAELVGRTVMESYPGIEATDMFAALRRSMQDRLAQLAEFEFTYPDGAQGWFEFSIQPVPEGIFILSLDVSERHQVQALLRKERAFLRKVIDTVPNEVFVKDADRRYLLANEAFARWSGTTVDWITGKTEADLGYVAASDGVAAQLDKEAEAVIGRREQITTEVQLLGPDRQPHWLTTVKVPLINEDGSCNSMLVVVTDITERRRTEAALRSSDTRYRSLFENMLEGYAYCEIILDQGQPNDFLYIEVNDVFEALTGLKDVTGRRVSEVIPGVQAANPELFEIYGRVASTGHPEKFETFVEGLGIWFSIAVYSPGPEHFVAVFDNITERKRVEAEIHQLNVDLEQRVAERTAALQESEERYRTLFDSIDEGFCIIEMIFDEQKKPVDFRFLEVNPSFEKQTGLTDAQGKSMRELAPNHEEYWFEIYGRIALTGESARFENRAEQLHRWYDVYASRFGKPEKRQVAILFNDITERKRAEENIRQANAQLADANKELEAFSYSVSHDLRAPLRGIDGWSLALLEDYHDTLDEQGRQYLDRVRSETQRMGQLIDDMLQLSRVTRAEMRQELVNLSALAQELSTRLQAAEPGRQAEFSIQANLSANGDANLLEVLLENLLSNAFKFTRPRAPARIEFGQAEADGHLAFFVRDNGAGFDMAYAHKLFGAFQRLHKASEFPGTGIGLVTVQRIVHRHGGRVWVEAEVDKGATFYFTLEGAR